MPDNVLPFEVPNKPRLKLQEPLPDQRKIVVLPFKAVFDKELGAAGVAVLAGLCAFCNRAGITWVSQRRLARDLNVSQPAISRQVSKLKKLGYIEVLRKGYAGAKNETIRVIFDPTITGEEAIAMVSNKEDARPPGLIAAEKERLQNEVDKEGLKRIAEMLKQTFNPTITPIKKEYQMPQDRETITVKQMKAKLKPKAHTTVDKPVDNSLHNQPLIQPEVISSDNAGLSKNTVFNISNINLIIMNEHKMKVSQADMEAKLALLVPAYKAEGIPPTDRLLAEGIVHMVATQAKMDAYSAGSVAP
jgi:Mn-dependent DtxR family transcriptional regulator